jgi:hypothetical protein
VTPRPGLGATNEACVAEVIDAMRTRVIADAPDAATGQQLARNLDQPEVQRNLAPIGDAVFRILTLRAQPVADATTDPAFWQWVADVHTRVAAIEAWQQGLAAAFTAWTPASPADLALKQAVLHLPAPAAGRPAVPTSVVGEVV